MTPLTLLLLLGFFFAVTLVLTIWTALTLGRSRSQGRARVSGASGSKGREAEEAARERKPWERGATGAPQPEGSLWVSPRSSGAAQRESGSARATVTPRKPDTDAFERFIRSEKQRE